jgi:hypothetical protein
MSGYATSAVALTITLALCGCAANPAPKPTSAAQNVSTGSRLPGGPACVASPCRTYTQDDIQRTGQTTVAGALSLLDPAVTVTH